MRMALWCALAGAGLVLMIGADRGSQEDAFGQTVPLVQTAGLAPAGPTGGELVTPGPVRPSQVGVRPDGGAGGLITHFVAQDGRPHTLVVIDPRQQALGVYHLDAASGAVTLKSVRQLTWDLQLIEYNNSDPLPQDIRSGLGN